MTPDLQHTLHQIAQDASAQHTAHGGLPIPELTARAHRSRRRHTTLAVSTTALVAGAVVVCTALLGRAPAPEPADPPTQANTPTASASPPSAPTAAPAVLPSGDPSLAFGECGSLVGATPRYPVDPQFTIADLANFDGAATTLAAGEPLRVAVTIGLSTGGNELSPSAVPEQGPTFAIAHDGVVVATADLFDGALRGWATSFYEDADSSQQGDVRLAVCDPGDGSPATAGRALPAGSYTIHPWAEVVDLGGQWLPPIDGYDREVVAANLASAIEADGVYATALGPVVPLTITGEAIDPQPTVPAAAPLDWGLRSALDCGSTAPDASTSHVPFRLTFDDPLPTVIQSGDELRARLRVTYDGGGRVRARVTPGASFWAVQGGVVVGRSQTPRIDVSGSEVDLGSGSSFELASDGLLLACTDGTTDGSPLGAGDYTILPGASVGRPDLWTSTGWIYGAADSTDSFLLGDPFELTID